MTQAFFAQNEDTIKGVNSYSVVQIFASRAIVAALLFLLISAIGSLIQKRLFTDKDTYKACDFAVSKYASLKYGPDVVLMGSSLIRLPFWLSDTECGVNISYENYVESVGFLSTIRHAGVPINSVFNFGLDGAMVSDVYLLQEKLFTSAKKPKIVVYGIGPRDFMDTSVRAETRTPAFERLYTVNDIVRDRFALTPNSQDKLELIGDRLFVLYSKRAQFQKQIAHRLATILKPKQDTPCLYKPETPWDKSIREYKGRYAQINQTQLSKQRRFLFFLLNRIRQKNITLFLVNMPLTRDNINLMPPGLYKDYLTSLKGIALQTSTVFIDLEDDKLQNNKFFDSAHLNSAGAHLIASRLATSISLAYFKQNRVLAVEKSAHHSFPN